MPNPIPASAARALRPPPRGAAGARTGAREPARRDRADLLTRLHRTAATIVLVGAAACSAGDAEPEQADPQRRELDLRVVGPQGAPIPGARIAGADGTGAGGAAVSGPDGTAHLTLEAWIPLTSMPPPWLRVEAAGHERAYVRVPRGPTRVDRPHVVTLVAARPFEARIRDGDGAAAAGVRVRLFASAREFVAAQDWHEAADLRVLGTTCRAGDLTPRTWSPRPVESREEHFEATTAGDGVARFEGLVAHASFEIELSRDGRALHAEPERLVPLHLAAGTITITAEERVLAVEVVDARGEPARGYFVWASPDERHAEQVNPGHEPILAACDAAGRADLGAIPWPVAWVGISGERIAEPVRVEISGPRQRATLRLDDRAYVSGDVVDARGAPVAGALVWIAEQAGGGRRETRSDALGRFRIGPVIGVSTRCRAEGPDGARGELTAFRGTHEARIHLRAP